MLEERIVHEVEEELRKLIQNEGLTPWRLETSAPTIMRLIGTSSGQKARDVIDRHLPEENERVFALRHAFGLEGNDTGGGLEDRRNALIASSRFPDVSIDTVRRWERKAIVALARKLVAVGHDKEGADPMHTALRAIYDAISEQTTVLREINDSLKHLAK